MKKQVPEVVISSGHNWNNFQWFLLGLYELKKKGEIKLKFDLPLFSGLLMKSNFEPLSWALQRLISRFEQGSYYMDGYILSGGGQKRFTIDCADAPYLYDAERLECADIYFKLQCPIKLNADGFRFTDDIVIPWLDKGHTDEALKQAERGERKLCAGFQANRYKIKPLMIGPRRLARGCCYAQLKKGYDNYRKAAVVKKTKKLMCYFGDSKGPEPSENVKFPDFDREADIVGYFGRSITHPNEKRARVADYINKAGEGCDGRVINRGTSDSGKKSNGELVVPLADFCRHVAQFQYNFNVSGYRLSIPNRFVESFMAGTAIVTDKLAVRWYKPFSEDEVFETVEMGYLPDASVDWDTFEKDLAGLPETNPDRILTQFEEKWSPETVAEYIVDTVMGGAG